MTNTYRSLQINDRVKNETRRTGPVQTLAPNFPVEFKSMSSTRFKGGKKYYNGVVAISVKTNKRIVLQECSRAD